MKILSKRFRVEFRHPNAMHTDWSYLPDARRLVREKRQFEDGKKGGFQQRIIRIEETVIA